MTDPEKPEKVELVNVPVDVNIISDATDGRFGRPGEQGLTGVTGAAGAAGARGQRGEQGDRGRSLTVWQAMAMFFLILIIGITLSVRTERQQQQIERNTRSLLVQRYEGCLNGVKTLETFNTQQRTLAEIERDLAKDPQASPAGQRAAAKRIRAYEDAIIPLGPKPCGDPPR